jgi:hypothetical protein
MLRGVSIPDQKATTLTPICFLNPRELKTRILYPNAL